MDLAALKEKLTPEVLESMTHEQQRLLHEKLKQLELYQRYNKIEVFNPYDYQRQFMAAGSNCLIRYLRAGNRTGKTYGAAAEFAYHITGRYPFWWEGARVEGAGHTFWAVGITLDSVSTVIQKELFGSADCRTDDIGTGALPRDCIVKDKGWQPDGPRLKSCLINHVSGRTNTLRFYGSENTAVMMGAKCALIWMDEESFNGIEVYTQCKTRLINALGPGKNGLLMITATPERGNTELNQLFDNDDSGLLYVQSASWDDCPHFSPEQIEQEESGYPEWQRKMRRHGLPVLGTGAVFDIGDEQITVPEVNPGHNWQVLRAIDWGVSHDPTVIITAYYNPDTDVYYLADCAYLDKSTYDRSPQNVANVILESPYPYAPVIRPHDHPALSTQLRAYGVNVLVAPAVNPPQTQLRVKRANPESRSAQDIQTGIDEMNYLFSEGRLKVSAQCVKWFNEKQTYQYQLNKNTGKTSRTGADHAIDASRYAVMALIFNRGVPVDEAQFPIADSFDAAPTLYL